jgi:hypothetical protein
MMSAKADINAKTQLNTKEGVVHENLTKRRNTINRR